MQILIAEKDETLRTIVSTRLRARHYETLEAASSEEALRLLENGRLDLALLSSEMERIGGLRLIEKIRQKPQFAALPVILLIEEKKIAELVTSHDYGFDDFLIKPFDPLVLQLRVAINITRVRHRMEANALTHLPGNVSIERAVREAIDSGEKFSVLYMDINNFKSFNDRYGFEKGDDVIRQTAQILSQTSGAVAAPGECFVGHIGGDDFVVLLPAEKEETFARRFISEFDRIMPTYYSEADQKRGFVRIKDRRGKPATFPLMSCSVAACNNLYRPYNNLGEIARDAAEVKAFLKSQPGSHYLRDRRSAQVREVSEALEILAPEVVEPKGLENNADPLGQVLVNAGLISPEQLNAALKTHLHTGKRLGQVLISMNAVRSEDVGRMLEKRLNIPYVSLKRFRMGRDLQRLFTFEFIRSHRVLPLETAGNKLRLGMCDPFDLRTMDSIERITGLKPVPCLALEDEFEEFLERFSKEPSLEEKAG